MDNKMTGIESRLLEIRADGTCIIALVTRFRNTTVREQAMLGRAGFGHDDNESRWYVLMTNIEEENGRSTHDPFLHPYGSVMFLAHLYLRDTNPAWLDDPNNKVLDVRNFERPARSEFPR